MSETGINPDDDPFRSGRTTRGTIRMVISVELEVDDEVGIIADSRGFQGITDEIGQGFVNIEAALSDSVGRQLAAQWPAAGRPVGTIHMFCGPISSAVQAGRRSGETA